MPRKSIVVFSGTGAQGFSVVNALMQHGKYRIRAVAKSTDNRKALLLRGKGTELVRAKLDDLEACKTAVKDAHGVFLVTNFWEHHDEEREFQQGKNVVDACIEGGVKHLVFSGQENVLKRSGYSCPHFDAKGRLEDYIQQTLPSTMNWTIIRMPFYFNNFLTANKPTASSDGTKMVEIPMGNCPLPGIDVRDVGRCVVTILDDPETYAQRVLGLAGGIHSVQEYCDILNKHLAPLVFKDGKQSLKRHAILPYPGGVEMASMFQFYQEGIERSVEITKKLNPKVCSFETFVQNHKKELSML